MGHDMDVPVQLPLFVGCVFVTEPCNPGIGAENIDRSEFSFDPRYQILHLAFARNIARHGECPDGFRDLV